MHEEFFDVIRKDHQEIKQMLNQIEKMPDSDYTRREEMFNKLKTELVPHMKAEEKAFYPVLRQNKQSKMDAMEALEEHHIAEVSMMELDKMSKQEEFWAPKLMVFKELINHHIKEEEDKVFKDSEELISHDQMQEIMRNFQEEKEKTRSKATTAPGRSS